VNGTHDIFCVLPATEDALAWELVNDMKVFSKNAPVVSSFADLEVVLKEP
jgi:hypothetical protein